MLVDKRDKRGGEKNWEWIKKGIPLRIEVGPRDLESQSAMVARRDRPLRISNRCRFKVFLDQIVPILGEIQQTYYQQAKAYREAHINRNIETFDQFKLFYSKK